MNQPVNPSLLPPPPSYEEATGQQPPTNTTPPPTFSNSSLPSTNTKPDEKDLKHTIHYVTTTDTLSGLTLKYNVKKEWIKEANRLVDDNIICRQYLVIPYAQWDSLSQGPSTDPQVLIIRDFQKQAQLAAIHQLKKKDLWVPREEAKSYLAMNNWVIEKAVSQWLLDIQWEMKNPYQGPSSSSKRK